MSGSCSGKGRRTTVDAALDRLGKTICDPGARAELDPDELQSAYVSKASGSVMRANLAHPDLDLPQLTSLALHDVLSETYDDHAMKDANRRSAGIPNAGRIVPWYQDFTLGPPRYGAAEVRAQIRAGYENGVKSWMLWNPGSRYTLGALEPAIAAADTVEPRQGGNTPAR